MYVCMQSKGIRQTPTFAFAMAENWRYFSAKLRQHQLDAFSLSLSLSPASSSRSRSSQIRDAKKHALGCRVCVRLWESEGIHGIILAYRSARSLSLRASPRSGVAGLTLGLDEHVSMNTLTPTNMAPVGGYQERSFPLGGTLCQVPY